MRRLILKSFQSPGDVLMLTAAVRDVHAAYPGRFQTDVRTSANALWQHNPFVTPLQEGAPDVEVLDMHYPLIHESNHAALPFPARLRPVPGTTSRSAHPRHALSRRCPSHKRRKDHAGPCRRARHTGRILDHSYPQHQFLSTVGALPCCADGGCWKSRCQTVGDGDDKDRRNLCENPVQIAPDLRIPKCMDMITPADVIRRIELYFQGGALISRAPLSRTSADANFRSLQDFGSLMRLDCAFQGGAVGRDSNPDRTVNQPATVGQDSSPDQNLSQPGQDRNPDLRPPPSPRRTSVLIKFRHGLGDAVQLTTVLQHLAHYHPDWDVDVSALVGKHSAFHGLCRKTFIQDRDPRPAAAYDRVVDHDWHECATCFPDSPSTKAERCLQEVFALAPKAKLCTYKIHVGDKAKELARGYLEEICRQPAGEDGRFPAVLIHYQGNTAEDKKNLPVEMIRRLCRVILECGYVPVILDWDCRTPLADGKTIHNPHTQLDLWGHTGTGDAEVLAALTEASVLMIGVDSGPLHVAGACSTPTLGVWTGHHPLHYFGLADNVTHLVPEQHTQLLRGNRETGEAFFRKHYRYQTYKDLAEFLTSLVKERLHQPDGNFIYTRNFWIRGDNAEQDLVVVQDVAEDDSYRTGDLPLERPVVIDVGAHIGCFTRKIHERIPLARIIAVECCPENLAALRKNVGRIARVLAAAVTYEKDVALMNAVFPNCVTTGGSTLISRQALEQKVASGELEPVQNGKLGKGYWADFRPVKTMTLEDILAENGLDRRLP